MQFRNYQLYACMAVLFPFQAATAQDNENVLEEITITGSRANFPRHKMHRFPLPF